MIYTKLATAFIIGSSWIIFIYFFRVVHRYKRTSVFKEGNCVEQWFGMEPYDLYTQYAPLYLGIMSAIAMSIHLYSKLSVHQSYSLVGLISPVLVSITITVCDLYTFTPGRLYEQYFYLLISHLIIFNVMSTIYTLIQ